MEQMCRIPTDLLRGDTAEILALAEGNWGIPKFEVDLLRAVCPGTGVIVGIIDTGIDDTHPDLRGNFLASKDFTNSGSGAKDRNGHGTHCSGTVGSTNPNIGVAYGAKIVHGKGLSDGGSGGGNGIAAAMRWCVEQGATILSLSLGSSGRDPAIDAAGQELTDKGIWICCAAGNSGGGTSAIDFPGRLPWAISVAALDQNLNVASFSSAGDGIETSAPGVNILSTRTGGGFQTMSGTSMATPFNAGLLAVYRSCLMLKAKPIPTTKGIQEMLNSDSMDVNIPGVDKRTGNGAIWPRLLLNNLVDAPPPVAA